MSTVSETWNQRVDMIVTDPIRGATMVVDVKVRFPREPLESSDVWRRLLRAREDLGASFALLFAPDRSALALPGGEILRFDSTEIAARYGLTNLPRLHGGMIAEQGLYTWLTDLTFGAGLASPPARFPNLRGDEVLWAA